MKNLNGFKELQIEDSRTIADGVQSATLMNVTGASGSPYSSGESAGDNSHIRFYRFPNGNTSVMTLHPDGTSVVRNYNPDGTLINASTTPPIPGAGTPCFGVIRGPGSGC